MFCFACRKQVQATKSDAERDGVVVPVTLQDYCVTAKPVPPEADVADFYNDDYLDEDDDDDDDDGMCYDDDEEDSGHGDS